MNIFKEILCAATLAAFPLTAIAQNWLTNGLVAFYPFNGNANDESGMGNHGTVNGATLSASRFGTPNNAFSFDGTNSFIQLPPSAAFASQDFTLSLWFKAGKFPDASGTGPNAAEMLVSRGRNNFELHLGAPPFGNRGIRFLPRQIAGFSHDWDVRSIAFDTNAWTHLVAIYQGVSNTARILLNGRELAVTHTTGLDTSNNSLPARLGMRYDGSVPFRGVLDDVRIYNRALSSNEVVQLYGMEAAPPITIRKAVYVDSDYLKTGNVYQVQVSTDLTTWTNYGTSFLATNSYWRSPNFWDVDTWDKLYFRLQPQ